MTDQAQILAIAGACGWVHWDGQCAMPASDQRDIALKLGWFNPLHSLDAMHEAERCRA